MIAGRRLKTWSLLALVNVLWAAQYPAYCVVAETGSVRRISFRTFVIASVVLLPALTLERRRRALATGGSRVGTPWVFLRLAALGLIPPVVILGAIVWGGAMLLWLWLLNQLEFVQASVSVYMLPVFGVLLSAATLGRAFGSHMQVIGGALVLLPAYASSAPPTEPAPAAHDGSGGAVWSSRRAAPGTPRSPPSIPAR